MPQDVQNQHLTQDAHDTWMEAPLLTQNGCRAGWESREERRAAENVRGQAPPANLHALTGQRTDRLKNTTSAR